MVLIAAFLGWLFDGLEQGVFPLVARPALQDLLHVESDKDIGMWMGYITALFLVGAAGGGLLFGWLGDRLGRVTGHDLECAGLFAFHGLQLLGTSSLAVGLVSFPRGPGYGRGMVSGGGAGDGVLAGAAPAVAGWRYRRRREPRFWVARRVGDGISSQPGFMALGYARGGRTRLANPLYRAVRPRVATLAGISQDQGLEAIQGDLRAALAAEDLAGDRFASIALVGTWGSVQWLPAWADQLTHGKVHNAKGITQMLCAAGAIVGCFVGPWIGGRFGRRPAYFMLCLVSLVSCACLFRCVHEYGPLFLLLDMLVGGATAAFYGWLPLYLPELFPTRARATGQGLCYNSGRILAAVGAIQMGRLLQAYEGSYARAGAVITLVYALGLGLIWLAPETKGKPLPE